MAGTRHGGNAGSDGLTRAERRRLERDLGFHRSASKRGRHGRYREPRPAAAAPELRALADAGFAIARPKIWVPGSE